MRSSPPGTASGSSSATSAATARNTVPLARHVLSAFRRSAAAAPALDQLASDISQAIRPHLGEEDFVTAALAQITPGGELTIVNCGPARRCCTTAAICGHSPASTADPPLGLEDDFTAFTARWRPGDRLLLYTDGLVESRNRHGDFLPDDQIATALARRLRPGTGRADDSRAPAHRRARPRRHRAPPAGIRRASARQRQLTPSSKGAPPRQHRSSDQRR